jgi:hypothetical protein
MSRRREKKAKKGYASENWIYEEDPNASSSTHGANEGYVSGGCGYEYSNTGSSTQAANEGYVPGGRVYEYSNAGPSTQTQGANEGYVAEGWEQGYSNYYPSTQEGANGSGDPYFLGNSYENVSAEELPYHDT